MGSQQLQQFCALSEDCLNLLRTAMQRMSLSARAYDRILKVARTIADLEGTSDILASHIAEAILYRTLDKEAWGTN